MKLHLISLLLFYTAFNLSAQNADFAPVGTKWYFSERDFALRWIPHLVESVAKEIHQGKLCSKLVSSGVGPLPSPTYIYSQNDTVFFYSEWTNQFEMLYDFTAEVGDQWVVGGIYSVDDNGNVLLADTITVDSMSLLSINGLNLKVWHISHGLFYDWGRDIVEKIGNTSLFAPKYAMWELQVGNLRCFETSDTIFHFVPYPCDTVIWTISETIDPNEKSGMAVNPNPFQEQITVTSVSLTEPYAFTLFDQSGRIVRRVQNCLGVLEVNTAPLPAGIYLWKVELDQGKFISGKSVKL